MAKRRPTALRAGSPRQPPRVCDVGESGLLAMLHERLKVAGADVVVSVGDDAAVLRSVGPHAVLTTDMLVEGVDFEFRWARPADVGHKAAAVNLSDLAAMGATPRALLLSLALRPNDLVADVRALVFALARLGERAGAPLVGGDLSSTDGPLVVSVTAVGQVGRGRALRRHRAEPGDVVLVSGSLGGAAAGLHGLQRGFAISQALRRRQLRPSPRLALGAALVETGAVRSCADVSDGLASDVRHLPRAGAGVALDVACLPLQRGVIDVAARLGIPPWQLGLTGGEDFELVMAVAPRRVGLAMDSGRRVGVRLRAIGEVVSRPGLHLSEQPFVGGAGFDHFRRSIHAPNV